MPVQNYRQLLVWEAAIDFVKAVYEVTATFPKSELYGLTNQLRRAAISIPSNIAEGQGRGNGAEFAHHCRIAQGSLQEAETQIIIAKELDYMTDKDCDHLLEKAATVGRLNRGLHRSINK